MTALEVEPITAEPDAPASDRFEDAFWPLYLRALRTAFRLVGDRDAAEDIAADSLARAHLHWGRISGLAHRDAWVLRVAANLSLDSIRRKRPTVDAPRVVAFEDRSVDRIALLKALRKLPRRQREAVTLRYLAELSHEEIGLALGIAEASVRVHVHRGLIALRTDIANEEL